jgi:hypothetical protein
MLDYDNRCVIPFYVNRPTDPSRDEALTDMLYNVSSLVKARLGAQMTLDIEEGPHRLAEDLAVEYLRGTVRLIRTDHRLLVQARVDTEVPAECVRCLEPFQLQLKVRFELFIFPESPDKTYHIDEDGFLHLDKPCPRGSWRCLYRPCVVRLQGVAANGAELNEDGILAEDNPRLSGTGVASR